MENKLNNQVKTPQMMPIYEGLKDKKHEEAEFEYIEDTNENFGVEYHPFLTQPLIEDEETKNV